MNNGKFTAKDGALVFLKTGKAIPEDEPVFILRASDTTALSVLRVYQSSIRPLEEDWKGVQQVMNDFTAFRQAHPERMLPPTEAYEA